jgi:ribonuclease HII
MLTYDTALYEKGYCLIAGVDEAGRGPLAGPVVAAAVILDKDILIPGIDDSKKLSEPRRESLYKKIEQSAAAYGVGIVKEDVIDNINILRASLEAMRLAILDLSMEPDFLLIDGLYVPDTNFPSEAVTHGDNLSASIAAASIVAKVTRDRIMREYGKIYPQYGFSRHKGYPTPQHLAALDEFGPCDIHRRSFAPVLKRLSQSRPPLD